MIASPGPRTVRRPAGPEAVEPAPAPGGFAGLRHEHVAMLSAGAATAEGNVAVVWAGAGLSQAGFLWDGGRHRAFASAGGHADFAPRNELQAGLLRALQPQLGHVSYAHVCSEQGLVDVHGYLRESAEPAVGRPHPGPIVAAALAGSDSTCRWALDVVISVLGADAGNVALALMATGGVYLGGSLAPQILPRLREGGLMRAFLDKGPYRELLERIPVAVLLDDGAVVAAL